MRSFPFTVSRGDLVPFGNVARANPSARYPVAVAEGKELDARHSETMARWVRKRATTNGDGIEHPQRGSTDRATGLRSWSRSAHTLRARISGWAARRPFANGWSTSLESHASTAGQSRNGANDRRDRICCEGPTRRPHEVYVVGTARHGAHRSRTGQFGVPATRRLLPMLDGLGTPCSRPQKPPGKLARTTELWANGRGRHLECLNAASIALPRSGRRLRAVGLIQGCRQLCRT